MTVSISDIQGLPSDMTSNEYTYLYFLNVETGETSRKRFPVDWQRWYQNIPFLERNNLKTWQDIVNYLNTLGYNEYLDLYSPYWFKWSRPEKKWFVSTNRGVVPEDTIFTFSPAIITEERSNRFVLTEEPRLTESVPVFYDRYTTDQSVHIYYTMSNELPVSLDLPHWLTELQGHTFVPSQHVFRSDKRDKSNLFFGLELEFSSKLSPVEFQYIVTQVEPKQEPFFYFKHDGSVTGTHNWKYELVTFPCTPSYMRKAFKTLFSKLESLAAAKNKQLSYFIDTSLRQSNGLHIHISKESFRRQNPVDSGRLWKNKFVAIWNQWDNSNQQFLRKLSRRVSSDNFYYKPHVRHVGRTLATRLKNGGICETRDDRYASCRETAQTVEVRVFQGQFDIQHVLYCIDMTCAMHQYSYEMPLSALGLKFKTSFSEWLAKQQYYNRIKKEVL